MSQSTPGTGGPTEMVMAGAAVGAEEVGKACRVRDRIRTITNLTHSHSVSTMVLTVLGYNYFRHFRHNTVYIS